MRYLKILLLLLCPFLCSAQRTYSNVPNSDVDQYSQFGDFQTFIGKGKTRLPAALIEPLVTYINLCPGGIIEDPLDASKFLFYTGEFTGYTTVGARIGMYICNKIDPYTISNRYGVVLQGGESYDINGSRFGCVFEEAGTVYYYYVGIDASYKWRICLATSTDGRAFTKQGVVMDYNDVDEKSVSDPSIVFENGVYYMAYSSWNGIGTYPNNNPGQSKIGIKIATSTDRINWTKLEKVVVPLGTTGEIDVNSIEGGHLDRMGDMWVILYTCNGANWSIGMAYSPNINSVFTKYSKTVPYLDKGAAAAWDDVLVAVALLYDFTGQQVMYYQAGAGNGEELPVGAVTIE